MTMTSAPLRARSALGAFIRDQASATKAELGFGWIAVPQAPSTFQQLRGAFAARQASGAPLPISSEFNSNSIYPSEETNTQFRFWHDCSHVRLGLSFSAEDELELALWHLSQLRRAGFDKNAAVYRLLQADLVGQILLLALIRRFPLDQASFVDACLDQAGLFGGLLTEIRRLP